MSAATVEAGGVPLAVDDRGEGAAVVFVHGTAASRTVWAEVVEALDDGSLRTVAYDRRAYGDSGAPEPYTATTVGEQADDLMELMSALGIDSAVLVGHALGALVALDVLMRAPASVGAAVLIEPPVLWLSPRGPETVGDLRDAIELGARDGGPAGAVDGYLEHVAGPDALSLYGPERVAAAHAATRAFVADLAAGPSWSATRRELRAIDAPVTLITGTRSSAVEHEVVSEMAGLLSAARRVDADAGHLVHVEAPEAVAAEVRALL